MTEPRTITLKTKNLSFTAHEMGTGPLVLCLHGFPDHNRSFRHQLPAFAKAGYRAVAPAMRGYEPSSQPKDDDYHLVRMAEDVLGWLDFLKEDKCHLVGHDWGSMIGYAATALAPERVHSLSILAVPPLKRLPHGVRKYPGQMRKSWYTMFFQLRGLSDYVVERNDYAFLDKLWRDWSPGWDYPREEMDSLKATFRMPGVKKAALDYYRNFFDMRSKAARDTRTLTRATIPVPTLAMTGALDGCMDTRLYDAVCNPDDFPGGLRVVRVQGAGHFLHQEKPEEVNRHLLAWAVAADPDNRQVQ